MTTRIENEFNSTLHDNRQAMLADIAYKFMTADGANDPETVDEMGCSDDGMAETADEARARMSEMLTEANGEPTEAPLPHIATTEAGQKGTREQVEDWWSDEIAAGWVSPLQVYGGWVAR